jgi:glucose-1-phosphate adenylyltransferase
VRRSSCTIRGGPIFTHARYLPGARLNDCTAHEAIVCEGCFVDRSTINGRSSASAPTFRRDRRSGGRCCSAQDFYESDSSGPIMRDRPRLGIGRDVVLDRVIVDKNARIGDGAQLVNEAGVQHADGDGYFIRDGIIVVPKDGVVKPGTRV